MEPFNLCIIKPNKDAFSETFIQEHIDRLPGNKKVLYGGAFPVYDHEGKFLIRSWIGLASYLFQKRVLKKIEIGIRTSALVKYLNHEKIAIVIAEYGMVGAMVSEACKVAGIPLIIHYHGADVHHRETVSKYINLYKKAFAYASWLIAVSGDMVDELVRLGAPAGKIVKSSCGVDTAKFPQLDISKSPRNFLSVGRFVEKKSPASIVKAFIPVSRKFPDAKMWMVGGGPLFDETKQLVHNYQLNEKIILTGVLKTEEIKVLMNNSRCFVQHSVTAVNGDKEGTPVTILEAGSSGLAIVSTKHAGIREAVVNGETGFLVDEYDVDDMAACMLKIADDVMLAVELGAKEAAYIRQNYEMQDRIITLTSLIKQTLKMN